MPLLLSPIPPENPRCRSVSPVVDAILLAACTLLSGNPICFVGLPVRGTARSSIRGIAREPINSVSVSPFLQFNLVFLWLRVHLRAPLPSAFSFLLRSFLRMVARPRDLGTVGFPNRSRLRSLGS